MDQKVAESLDSQPREEREGRRDPRIRWSSPVFAIWRRCSARQTMDGRDRRPTESIIPVYDVTPQYRSCGSPDELIRHREDDPQCMGETA
jgi:hypothetical protein